MEPKKNDNDSSLSHMLVKKSRYFCDQCDYHTRVLYSFHRHKGDHLLMPDGHPVVGKKHNPLGKAIQICEYCQYFTIHPNVFQEHVEKHSSSDNISLSVNSENNNSVKQNDVGSPVSPPLLEKSFVCATCGFSTSYKGIFDYHLSNHSNEKGKLNAQHTATSQGSSQSVLHSPEILNCQQLSENFKRSPSPSTNKTPVTNYQNQSPNVFKQRQTKKKTTKKQTTQKQCAKKKKTEVDVILKVGQVDNYRCPHCPTYFTKVDLFRNHVQIHHEQVDMSFCKICSFLFKN